VGKIKPTQRIFDVIEEIKNDNYRLPSIQRSFVWEQDRICKLMDSLMSDYPIGSFLVWKPPEILKVRTRKFTQDYKTGDRLISEEEPMQSSPYLVLDGQQRLQSLYMGFFGSYDGEYLYFKLDSNPDVEENDLKYHFQFMTPEQAKKDPHWVRPTEIVNLNIEEISEFVDNKFDGDADEVKKIVKRNLGRFIRVFNMDDKIPLQDVKENLPYNDILEVFVRVNSGGMVLTKSDLLFSTVVLNIPNMERKFIELVDELNGGGEFDFDIDFIIKTSFVVLNKGAKYDVDKLKDGKYINKLKNEFDKISNSLFSATEFIRTDAKILSKRFLKSDLALIPIIDFIFQQPHQQLPEGQSTRLRQYLYMSFFMRFYSYGPDGKLDIIHRIIKENGTTNTFPIDKIRKYIAKRTGVNFEFVKSMLNDLDLVLNIIRGGVSEIPKKRGWSLERDHIFPRSLLKDRNMSEEFIDNVGNLRLINKTRNILKSNDLPESDVDFFGSNVPELKQLFLKAREDLTEENFKNFVLKREGLISNRVKAFLGL